MTNVGPTLSALRTEVRRLSRKARRLAEAFAASTDNDTYHATLVGMFDDWIDQGSARRQVVCLAAATELGLPVLHYAERCYAAVASDGSDALRVLYWTVAHRVRATQPPWRANLMRRVPSSPAREAQAPALCPHCLALSRDPLQGDHHPALLLDGPTRWRRFGASVVFEVQEYRCTECKTAWAKRHSGHDPFTAWAIS